MLGFALLEKCWPASGPKGNTWPPSVWKSCGTRCRQWTHFHAYTPTRIQPLLRKKIHNRCVPNPRRMPTCIVTKLALPHHAIVMSSLQWSPFLPLYTSETLACCCALLEKRRIDSFPTVFTVTHTPYHNRVSIDYSFGGSGFKSLRAHYNSVAFELCTNLQPPRTWDALTHRTRVSSS